MHFCFVTFGNFKSHSTLKRATGMAGPLAQMGHRVTLLLEDSLDNREKAKLECPDTQVVWHKRSKWFGPERTQKQRAIRKLQPDIVWICGVGARNWITHRGHNAIVLADHSELYSAVQPKAYERAAYRVLERLYLYSFDGHICASRYLFDHYSRQLQKIGKPVRVHHSPYAYHESALTVPPRPSKSETKSILYLGSFWENYGFWEMLESIKILSLQRQDIRATFIGRGPDAERGKAWVLDNKMQKFIHFPGYVDDRDLGNYMVTADVFLSPMRDTVQDWARCPSKQYLYLPFRQPVVTAKIGESLNVFGENGCYYECQNAHSMAEAISNALDRPQDFPSPDPVQHTFTSRTVAFMAWLNHAFKSQLA